MGYTIAIIRREDAKKILASKDVNAVIPIDECTYEKAVLEKPLDKIYAGLSAVYPPLNGPEALPDEMVDECVVYNCDWGTMSLPAHSLKVGLVRLKHWFKANRWAIALRDTLFLYLLCDMTFLGIWYLMGQMEGRAACLSSMPFASLTIGAAVVSSLRIWVEIYVYFKAKQ